MPRQKEDRHLVDHFISVKEVPGQRVFGGHDFW